MGTPRETSGPQFRSDRPEEQRAVRTTIVGGRPPGSGRGLGDVPRGIEVLVKKAAVDPEFRKVLLEQRAGAAAEIGLALDPAETAIIAAVPAAQLNAIIDQTTVPREHRRVFLGKVATAMLATVGLSTTTGCFLGSQPDRPAPAGIAPDRPEPDPEDDSEGVEPPTDVEVEPTDSEVEPDTPIRGTRPDRIPAPEGNPPGPTAESERGGS